MEGEGTFKYNNQNSPHWEGSEVGTWGQLEQRHQGENPSWVFKEHLVVQYSWKM